MRHLKKGRRGGGGGGGKQHSAFQAPGGFIMKSVALAQIQKARSGRTFRKGLWFGRVTGAGQTPREHWQETRRKQTFYPCVSLRTKYGSQRTNPTGMTIPEWWKAMYAGVLGDSVGWASDFYSGQNLEVRGFEPHVRFCADGSESGACF